TGGICRPCEQLIARQQHEAHVKANRREIDRFASAMDPLEILDLLLNPPPFDELVIEKPYPGQVDDLVASLNSDLLNKAINLALSYLAEGKKRQAENLGRWLAAFTHDDLSQLQHALIESRLFYPGIIFRAASQQIAEEVLAALPTETLPLNHALIALSWIG